MRKIFFKGSKSPEVMLWEHQGRTFSLDMQRLHDSRNELKVTCDGRDFYLSKLLLLSWQVKRANSDLDIIKRLNHFASIVEQNI